MAFLKCEQDTWSLSYNRDISNACKTLNIILLKHEHVKKKNFSGFV